MSLYYDLCRQEQPDLSHKMPQKMLILLLGEWYSNCYMSPEMASNYNPWQVSSVLVFLMVYHKSTFGKTLMYMQHRHMECVEYHICHEQVLDKNVNGNTYSAPLLHAALDVDHKVVIMVIGLYHNTFYIFVCNISIILNMILSVWIFSLTGSFPIFSWSMTQCLRCSSDRCFWDCLARLTSFLCVQECIRICE